jgi:hypothetical protein
MEALRHLALWHMLTFSPSTFHNPCSGTIVHVEANTDWGTNVFADVWTYEGGYAYRCVHEQWVVGRGLRARCE